jgi:hypothetical protein
MAIYSDMQGFPESGMPTLKDVKGRAKADEYLTNTSLVNFGNRNTLNVGAGASRIAVLGTGNSATLPEASTGRSVSIGIDNIAATPQNVTQSSCAIGIGNNGNATNIGFNNTVTGTISQFGIGSNNSGQGYLVGFSNTSASNASFGIGYQNTNGTGGFQCAIGYQNNTSGANLYATSIGNQNTCSPLFGLALGLFNQSTGTGQYQTTIGLGCTATANSAMAMGFGANATTALAGIIGYAPTTLAVTNATANSLMIAYEGTNFLLDANRITANKPVRLPRYTVATLPAGVIGDTAFATDLLAPTYLAAVVGGGAIGAPVFHDGAGWKVG